MGMYDGINVFMPCPNCKQYSTFGLQTKDLQCCLYAYCPLDEDWYTNKISGKPLREKMPVFPSVPGDKEPSVWANQAEKVEAFANTGSELEYIEAYGTCPKCKNWIEGKIKIENGYLIKPLYDITVNQDT